MNTVTVIFTGLVYLGTGGDPAVLSNIPVRVIMPTTDHTSCIDNQSGVIPPHVAFVMYEESQRVNGTRASDAKVVIDGTEYGVCFIGGEKLTLSGAFVAADNPLVGYFGPEKACCEYLSRRAENRKRLSLAYAAHLVQACPACPTKISNNFTDPKASEQYVTAMIDIALGEFSTTSVDANPWIFYPNNQPGGTTLKQRTAQQVSIDLRSAENKICFQSARFDPHNPLTPPNPLCLDGAGNKLDVWIGNAPVADVLEQDKEGRLEIVDFHFGHYYDMVDNLSSGSYPIPHRVPPKHVNGANCPPLLGE